MEKKPPKHSLDPVSDFFNRVNKWASSVIKKNKLPAPNDIYFLQSNGSYKNLKYSKKDELPSKIKAGPLYLFLDKNLPPSYQAALALHLLPQLRKLCKTENERKLVNLTIQLYETVKDTDFKIIYRPRLDKIQKIQNAQKAAAIQRRKTELHKDFQKRYIELKVRYPNLSNMQICDKIAKEHNKTSEGKGITKYAVDKALIRLKKNSSQ